MSLRVGIDLGTTYSAVAYINQQTGKPQVIKNRYKSSVTPSVLCFLPDGNVLFGEDAKEEYSFGNENAAAFYKRDMGNKNYSFNFYGKEYDATDLSAIFLKNLKEDAEKQIGDTIDSAVITVPAYFTHIEREATMRAGERAGLNVISIINEPTAAALAYGLTGQSGTKTILIYDLGGGTFDITIAKITPDSVNILGSRGNHALGGKDWDDCIANYLTDQFAEQTGIEIHDDLETFSALLVTAEEVKKKLTSQSKVSVPISAKGTKTTVEITYETFEEISSYYLNITKDLIADLLKSLKMEWKDIDDTILVGGSTRMRMVSSYIIEMTGKHPLGGVDVDEAVALGAAIKANIDEHGRGLLISGNNSAGNSARPLIAGAKAIRDVTSHSLGMIAINEDSTRYINSCIIPKDHSIPASETRPYELMTSPNDENVMEVYVLQGDAVRPLDNIILSKYVISGIRHTSEGKASIDVTYTYTENGVAKVSAVQKNNNNSTLNVSAEAVPDDMHWTDESPRDHVTKNTVQQTLQVILAIDLSGSMSGRPLKEAKKAMLSFVDQVSDMNAEIGVVGFDDTAYCEIEPTNDYFSVKKTIVKLHIGGGTVGDPFALAKGIFDKSAIDQYTIKYVILLSDGEWYGPKPILASAKRCHAAGIEIMALGFGEADEAFLKQVASTEDFATLTDLTQLSTSFSKIAQVVKSGQTGLKRN